MIRTIETTTLLLVIALSPLSLMAQQKQTAPADKTLTGVVSDSMCGAKHMAKDKTPAQCTRECVKAGSDYALVVGDKIYTLKGNRSELDKYAGTRVTVKGSLSGDAISAESITPAKE